MNILPNTLTPSIGIVGVGVRRVAVVYYCVFTGSTDDPFNARKR